MWSAKGKLKLTNHISTISPALQFLSKLSHASRFLDGLTGKEKAVALLELTLFL
jgi:hypothetical protein